LPCAEQNNEAGGNCKAGIWWTSWWINFQKIVKKELLPSVPDRNKFVSEIRQNGTYGKASVVSAWNNNNQQLLVMEQRIVHECVSFDHSLVFANANLADIPATSKGLGYVSNLTGIYTQLVNAGATQKPISVAAQNALILALETQLDNLATIAGARTGHHADEINQREKLSLPEPHSNGCGFFATASSRGDEAQTSKSKMNRK
jgi:hypothetical protein